MSTIFTVELDSAAGLSGTMFKPPGWRWVQAGSIGWWVRVPWLDVLLGREGLRLEQWRAEGRVRIVKAGPYRVVSRVELPQGAIYIKHYLVPDWRSTLRQWFRRGKGRNEGKRSRFLASMGIPTISPIALGERRKRGFLFENFLITPEIADTLPLDEFLEERLDDWDEPMRSRIRHQIAAELGKLTARLHNAGLLHTDFHPGNLLVRMGPGDVPELIMIDLDALRRCWRVGTVRAIRNLALLDHYFWLRSSRTDRRRFLKSYLEHRSMPGLNPRRLARGVEESTRAWAERLWRRWGRRCRSTNKYFRVHARPGTWCVAVRDFTPEELGDLLVDPDLPFRKPETVVLKDSRTATVAKTTLVLAGKPVPVIYKRFHRKKWFDPLLTLFRPSRAWRSWQAGQHLASRGIPTPRNLAFLARKRRFRSHPLSWFLPRETYLVTHLQENAMPLSEYLRTTLADLDPADRRSQVRHIGQALARLVRSLHERSLSHRDLKASNILIHTDALQTNSFLSLIDLVGVQLLCPVPWSRKIQNLARLSVSLSQAPGRTRTESLRFLQTYLPWGLSPLSAWKRVWRATERAIDTKRSRNRRRGRPLS